MSREATSFKVLTEEIIEKGECARCGACVELCPYLSLYEGAIVYPDACDLTGGRCLSFCPKGPLDLEALARMCWNGPYEGTPLGPVSKVVMARVPGSAGAQYGGVVTALVRAAVSENGMAGALLTAWKDRAYPEGAVLDDPGDLPYHGGVHYAAGYGLAALNRFRKSNPSPLTIVGLPCQAMALRRMHALDHERNIHRNKDDLVIGLFCTWALEPRPFREEMIRRFGSRRVTRYDIPPPPANRFDVFFEDGDKAEIPLDVIRSLVNPGCRTCLDMTAEFADISVGAAEGFEGWNTVIIRTPKGAALFERLNGERIIETRALPVASLAHLSEAAAMKKKKALNALAEKDLLDNRVTLPSGTREAIFNFQPGGGK